MSAAVETARPILISTGDVAALYGLPPGTVYRWACEDGWTKYGPRHDRRWDLDDVESSMTRRRRARPT